MAYSEAQKRATAKYMKANLADIKIRVKKGERDIYKSRIDNLGYTSVNDFVIQAINEKLKKEESV